MNGKRKRHSAEFKAKIALFGLGSYFHFYNRLRFHQALDYATPEEVYQGRRVGF